MGLAGVAEAENVNETRRAKRRDTRSASTLRADGVVPIDVIVLDVSATGVRIVADVDLPIGCEVSIGLAGMGATRAFVVWKDRPMYGCSFEKTLPPEVEARAFSSSRPVPLGRQPAPSVAQENATTLPDLYAQHHFWSLPADAIAAMIAFVGLLGSLAWWELAR